MQAAIQNFCTPLMSDIMDDSTIELLDSKNGGSRYNCVAICYGSWDMPKWKKQTQPMDCGRHFDFQVG